MPAVEGGTWVGLRLQVERQDTPLSAGTFDIRGGCADIGIEEYLGRYNASRSPLPAVVRHLRSCQCPMFCSMRGKPHS